MAEVDDLGDGEGGDEESDLPLQQKVAIVMVALGEEIRIVQQVRQLEEQGQVTIVRGDSDDQFV
jgi:L-alanine-DL-glutamate epimerase-like enolase superfamily enzyme